MQELLKRIAELSPEKAKCFEQMLREKGLELSQVLALAGPREPEQRSDDVAVEAQRSGGLSADEAAGIDLGHAQVGSDPAPHEVKAMMRQFYNSVSARLNLSDAGDYSFFLTYGYVPDGGPQHSTVNLPEHCLNRNYIKLVVEVIGDSILTGRSVLDVGCGRGGTLHTIKRFYDPGPVVGVDLSSKAISFCKKAHGCALVDFLEADAERLPFADRSFDVVTNVESSHSYPDILAFYSEVFRVLKPGGHFLYTDLLPAASIDDYKRFLQGLGFVAEQERDITSNVLLSCDQIARKNLNVFGRDSDSQIINDFLATPGSEVYNDMKSRKSSYRIFRFKKAEG